MSDSDEQWSRICAESELRPERGVVAEVPTPQVTPLPEDEPSDDPIELAEVPPSADPEAETQPPSVQPIQVVPFHHDAAEEPGPDLIVAAPFAVPVVEAVPVADVAPEMITDVPVAAGDPVAVVADLPEEPAAVRTSWWRLLLTGGPQPPRHGLRPQAATAQPRPEPPRDGEPSA